MAITILMPALSPTMEEGALTKWSVKVGDRVAAGDVIAEIETDKATMEVEAADEGVVQALLVSEGTEGVKVNTPIAVLRDDDEQSAGAPPPPSLATPAPPAADALRDQPANAAHAPELERMFASPLARKLAADRTIDLASLTGSGPRGRIVKADVVGAAPMPIAAPAPETMAPPQTPPDATPQSVAALYAGRAFEEVPLDGMRKAIAARLTEAKRTIPHFYLRRDVELDRLLTMREELNRQTASRGVKLSVNDFIIKACALALQQTPDCNAVWAGDRILRFKASDVAVAVAVEGGLYTPVLRDAETKCIAALSAEMKDLAARARSRTLAPQEYLGGAFAISNLGMFGVDSFDAVINPPHAAILAVGAATRRPVARGDRVEVATCMALTLSVDHRVIDGGLGAQFLEAVKNHLEAPLALLI